MHHIHSGETFALGQSDLYLRKSGIVKTRAESTKYSNLSLWAKFNLNQLISCFSSANPPNLPRPPIHPHPHNHSHPLQPQQHQQPQQQLPVHTHPPTSHNGGPSMGGGGHGPSGPAPPPSSQNGGHGNAAAALNHHNHLGMVSHGHTHSPMQVLKAVFNWFCSGW